MITVKLKIQNKIDITAWQRQLNNVIRFAYNRLSGGDSLLSTVHACKKLNHIDLLDVSIISSACNKANEILSSEKERTKNVGKIVFGGKKLFKQRSQLKISADEFKVKKMMPFYMTGEKMSLGNRKFKLGIIKHNQIIFKPCKGINIVIKLPNLNKNQLKLLYKLEELSKKKKACFSVNLTNNDISISFEEDIIKDEKYIPKLNRILSVDTNPNYIGIAICDFDSKNEQTIIHKEIVNLKEIDDIDVRSLPSTDPKKIYKHNKKKHELCEAAQYIVNLARHYRCEIVGTEKLTIWSSDKGKGKRFNGYCNNKWCRKLFIENLTKWCNIKNIRIINILPQYSSFIGQMQHPDDCDMVAAALEIGRRANLFNRIYVRKDLNKTDIVYPKYELSEPSRNRWKEETSDARITTWKGLYHRFKESEISYRFPFTSVKNWDAVFRLKSSKSLMTRHEINLR